MKFEIGDGVKTARYGADRSVANLDSKGQV